MWRFALIVMAMTAIPIGRLIGQAITHEIDAPWQKVVAESVRKLAEDRAAAEAGAAAETLETDRKFVLIEERGRQAHAEYIKAVIANKPGRARELFTELLSYTPRPTIIRPQAIDTAKEDCLRPKAAASARP